MNTVEELKSLLLPLSAFCFIVVYPVCVFLWTLYDGMVASQAAKSARGVAEAVKVSDKVPEPFMKFTAETKSHVSTLERLGGTTSKKNPALGIFILVGLAALLSVATSTSFVAVQMPATVGPLPIAHDTTGPFLGSTPSDSPAPFAGAVLSLLGLSVGAVVGARRSMTRKASAVVPTVPQMSTDRLYNGCNGGKPCLEVKRYTCPASPPQSMWHNLDLHSKSWLRNDTDLYHYVNEMPLGSLQKFEMMPDEVENIIIEDERGSVGLAAFGHPVPFNYGCFPQTFRDPDEVDEISGAGGDNDPLDVIDLCPTEVGPGVVVTCRPLGAVCLIDEGEADWKILAVNVNSTDSLSSARSVDDIERLRPGRIQEVLQWMDDFKKMSCAEPGSAVLNFEIHDAERAKTIIETDHVSWQKLISLEPDANGFVKGHWIGSDSKRASFSEDLRLWSATQALPFAGVHGLDMTRKKLVDNMVRCGLPK